MSAVSESGTGLRQFVADVGALRLALYCLAAATIAFAGDPEFEAIRFGWALVTTLVIPALSPMVLMVLLFDMLMARVLMSDVQGAARARYRLVLKVDAAVVVLMLLAWGPFFLALRG